ALVEHASRLDGASGHGLRHWRVGHADHPRDHRRHDAHRFLLARTHGRRRVHASDSAARRGPQLVPRQNLHERRAHRRADRPRAGRLRARRAGRARGVKIALVCDWYAPRLGGIEVQLEALARRLTRAGHQIQIITTTPGPSAPGVVRLSVPLLAGVGVMYTGRGFAALDEALAGGGFDVVHSHISIVSPAAIGAGFLANRLGIPLVVTFHSWIPGMRALTRTIGGALGSRHWIALFTAVSARVAREVAPCAPGEHIELLPNGVDSTKWGQSPLISAAKTTGEFQEGQSRLIASKPFEIVSVMRLNAKKRPGALLSVMAELKRTLPARMNVRLRVAGDGPERAR